LPPSVEESRERIVRIAHSLERVILERRRIPEQREALLRHWATELERRSADGLDADEPVIDRDTMSALAFLRGKAEGIPTVVAELRARLVAAAEDYVAAQLAAAEAEQAAGGAGPQGRGAVARWRRAAIALRDQPDEAVADVVDHALGLPAQVSEAKS
jgi:hypothetical protein